jgi:SET domain-containing protein
MAIRLAIHITDADRQGPTNNVSYNNLLRRWGGTEPECEECGDDLTGQDVHETRYNWVCCGCADEASVCGGQSDYADRMDERRQMGLVNF